PSCVFQHPTPFLIPFLFCHLPQPYRLFPYTTLFRSVKMCSAADNATCSEAKNLLKRIVSEGGFALAFAADSDGAPLAVCGSNWLDRKSTRLNSSHVKSSYAVFCLKKKRNTKNSPKSK